MIDFLFLAFVFPFTIITGSQGNNYHVTNLTPPRQPASRAVEHKFILGFDLFLTSPFPFLVTSVINSSVTRCRLRDNELARNYFESPLFCEARLIATRPHQP
jgi:hypothetical protein